MSCFNGARRRALDRQFVLRQRFVPFLWLIEEYGYLTGESFHGTYARLGRHFGFDWARKPDDDQLTAAVELLTRERTEFLRRLQAFDQARRVEKANRQQRQPSKRALITLYFGEWFLAPGEHHKSRWSLKELAAAAV
jgi:hypothetical protein